MPVTETSIGQMLGEILTKRDELAKIFEKNKTADRSYELNEAERADVKARMEEVNELGTKYRETKDLFDLEKKNSLELEHLNKPIHPSSHGGGRGGFNASDPFPGQTAGLEKKKLGDHITEHKAFKEWQENHKSGGAFRPLSFDLPTLDVKTVMTETGTGFLPPNYRTPIVILSAQRRPVVGDLIPQEPTMLETVKYMLETTFTNSAAFTSEGGAAPASLIGYTEQSVLVQWLPTILPVTEQQLEDVPMLMSLINNRLTLMVSLAEETELLSGSGSSPHLQGFIGLSGINTTAMGSDPIFDAILKGITQVRYTGFAEPSGIVMHPTDWQTARLMKTTIGSYIMGSPDTVGPEMLFGLPVVVTPAISQGTTLLGAFNLYSAIYRRWGMRVEIGYVNDDFSRGQKTIRAATRLALVIYRPSAFATVTGV